MDIFVHIGMAKTGTTFFQDVVIPNMEGVKSLRFGRNVNIENILTENESKYLISNEGISGSLVDNNSLEVFDNRLERLKSILPNANIILSIRKHSDWIRSAYFQYATYYEPQLEFSDFFDVDNKNEGIVRYEDALFVPRIKMIREKFGRCFLFKTSDYKEIDDLMDKLENFVGGKFDREKIQNASPKNESVGKSILSFVREKRGAFSMLPDKAYSKLVRVMKKLSQKNDVNKVKEKYENKIDIIYQEDWNQAISEMHCGGHVNDPE